jgi:hypothetical protein
MNASSQDVYDALDDIVSEHASSLHASYTQNNKGNHLFNLYGNMHLYEKETFKKLHDIQEKFNPREVYLSNGVDGAHIQFEFPADRFDSLPEPVTSYGRIEPRDAEEGTVTECANCRKSTRGLYNPPATLMYPSEHEFESPTVEEHDLCVACSPGHFDDVTGPVKYFGVQDNQITKIGWETKDGVDWEDYDEIDNPYVETAVEAIEKMILD